MNNDGTVNLGKLLRDKLATPVKPAAIKKPINAAQVFGEGLDAQKHNLPDWAEPMMTERERERLYEQRTRTKEGRAMRLMELTLQLKAANWDLAKAKGRVMMIRREMDAIVRTEQGIK